MCRAASAHTVKPAAASQRLCNGALSQGGADGCGRGGGDAHRADSGDNNGDTEAMLDFGASAPATKHNDSFVFFFILELNPCAIRYS